MPSSNTTDTKLTKKRPSFLPLVGIGMFLFAASIAFSSLILAIVSPYQCITPQIMESQVMKIVCIENNWNGCLIFSLSFAFLVALYHALDSPIKESLLVTVFLFVMGFGCFYLGFMVAGNYIIDASTMNGCNVWLAMIYQSAAMAILCIIAIVKLKHSLYQFYCFVKRSVWIETINENLDQSTKTTT